jgi:hypothetical protein
MNHRIGFAGFFAFMLILSGVSMAKQTYAVTQEEEEQKTRATSGRIVEVQYYCSSSSSSVEQESRTDPPAYCKEVTPGKFKAGQTVYTFVTIENTDIRRGTYYIEFYVTDENGKQWLGEEKRTPLRPNEKNSYALGWTIPDNAPTGKYTGYVVLYGEKTEQTKQGIVATKSKLESKVKIDAFTIIPSKDIYFIARIVDQNNEPVDMVALNVVEKFGVSAIKNYTLPVNTFPERFAVQWLVPNYQDGSTIEITAVKDGYKKSKAFVYKISRNSPSSGELFEHTFVLEKEQIVEEEVPIEKRGLRTFSEKIFVNDSEYVAGIVTTSDVTAVTLNQELKRIVFDIEQLGSRGSANITMPKTLIGGPFTVNKSGATFTQNATHSSIYLTYDAGAQTIEITGASVVPEFPLSIVVISIAMSIVIFGMFLARKRSNGLLGPNSVSR